MLANNSLNWTKSFVTALAFVTTAYYLDHLIDDSPRRLCNYSGMDKRDARLPGL